MGEPYGLPGLDPIKTRMLLGALALLLCGLLAVVPVDGLDPATGVRTTTTPAQADAQTNARLAIAALEELAAAQALLRKVTDGDGVVEYGTLADLHAAGLIDADLADGRAHGHVFVVRPSAARPEFAWIGTATPEQGGPGAPTFVVNQEGLVHVTRGQVALDDGCAIPTSATRVGG